MPQSAEPFLRYHIEHIVPRQHGGADTEDNLALACPSCNLHKGTNLTSIDVVTGEMTPLFHPRQHRWSQHFDFSADGILIIGVSAVGRSTTRLLKMNASDRMELRMHLLR